MNGKGRSFEIWRIIILSARDRLIFFKTFLPLIAPNLSLDDILADDNDGVLNGNLLEFKLRVNDLNAVLF